MAELADHPIIDALKQGRDWATDLSPSVGGIALGCVGFSNTILILADIFKRPMLKCVFAYPMFGVSFLYVLLFFLRICLDLSKFAKEVKSPGALSCYAAFLMGFIQLFLLLAPIAGMLSFVCVSVLTVLEMLLLFQFLFCCWQVSCYPEPLWFPPTVGIAVSAFVLDHLNASREIVETIFWFATLLCLVLVPIVLYRVLPIEKETTLDPTIFILTAPFSLITSSWITINGSAFLESSINGILGTVFFSLSTTMFVITIYCVFKRRKYILNRFDSSWAACTFSSAVTAKSSVLYHSSYGGKGTLVWSVILCTVLLGLVLCVIFRYTVDIFYHLYANKKEKQDVIDDLESSPEEEKEVQLT